MSATSIPAFHVSGPSSAKGEAVVFIASRQDAVSTGKFQISIDVHFDPAGADMYPTGTLSIRSDLSDSADGTYIATSIELINSYGKHNPTIYLTGQCKADAAMKLQGGRYWVMIANNKNASSQGTPDVVGFVIHDRNGNRFAYGTGPVQSGDIEVAPH